jgi:HK97 family phage prohead protease
MTLIRKTTETEDGGPDFCCNSGQLDRYGDVVVPAGIDLNPFLKNNIALFNHSPNAPIGVWRNMRVEAGELRGRLELAPEGTSPRVDEIRKLVKAKVLKATSIGFIPHASEPLTNEKGNRTGTRYTKSELVEISLVSTPADGNAVALAKSLKISDATMREVFKRSEDLTVGGRVRRARVTVRKARAMLAKTTNERHRMSLMRAIAYLEKEDRERTAESRKLDREREKQVARTAAEEREQLEVARIVNEERASPAWQKKKAEAEAIAAFTRTQARLERQATPKPEKSYRTSEEGVVRWRGQKIDPRSTWKGKKV